jgi:hypothetical protein
VSNYVTKDVPPYTIVGGNPARVIRTRFNEKQIKCLELIKWWDFPEAKVRKLMPSLLSADVDNFITKAVELIEAEHPATLDQIATMVGQESAELESLDG